ncbi:hypothetical protein WA026_006828, partial [Henosepilachna vigintioctopunctata]
RPGVALRLQTELLTGNVNSETPFNEKSNNKVIFAYKYIMANKFDVIFNAVNEKR